MHVNDAIDNARNGAHAYASRWTVDRWFAYCWMFNELLAGRMKYLAVEDAHARAKPLPHALIA